MLRSFYESLADGLPADAAVAEARKAVSIAVTGTLEWGTPVLFMRAADGAIFDLADQRPAAPPLQATDMADPAPQKSARAEEQKTPQELPTQTKSTTLPTGTGGTGQAAAKPPRQRTKPGTTVKPSPPKPEPGAIVTAPEDRVCCDDRASPTKDRARGECEERSDAEPRKTARPGPDVSRVSAPKQRLSRLNLDLFVQPVSVEDGGAITWTITASNAGDDDLREVEVRIGSLSLGTFALPVGEGRQMTGSATLEGSTNPTVIHFAAHGP